VGGPLRGGDPGVPLIPSADTKPGDFFNHVPEAPIIPEGKVKLLPLPHIFGSEEWSAKCQGIQARSPGPFLAVHPEDARGWGMEEGDLARLELADGRSLSLPVQYSPTLARGTTGLPVGFPGLEGAALPALTGRPTKAD
jgi:NADH-quinone oxidoreductase subunit G